MFGQLRGIALMAVLASAAASTSCGGGSIDHPTPESAVEELRAGEPETSVATVGERSIGIDTFQRYWERTPDTEVGTIVEEVVRREVAVQQALDAGLHRDEALGRVRKRAMVRELLRRELEREIGPADLDETRVDSTVEDIRSKLGRPAGIRATHLLVMPGSRKSGKEDGRVGSDSEREEARRWAERIRGEVSENPSVTELFEIRRKYLDKVPEKFRVVVDAHLRFPSPDARPFDGSLPDRWISVVDPFASKAHELAQNDRVGQLSEPVESPFGWHLIRPEERLEAKIPEPEATREVAVSRRLRERRRDRFKEVWNEWRGRASIAMNPNALDEQEK